MNLEHSEIQRYQQQLLLPKFGMSAQERLKSGKVMVFDCGELAGFLVLHLAALGVGRIGIVDSSKVELSDLGIIYNSSDLGKEKIKTLAKKANSINPSVSLETHSYSFSSQKISKNLTPKNAIDISQEYEVLVDATNLLPHFINDLATITKKKFSFGIISEFEGQTGIFDAQSGACYRCLYPKDPPYSEKRGKFGAMPTLLATLQAIQIAKLIAQIGKPLEQLIKIDAFEMKFSKKSFSKDPNCKVCSENPTITKLLDFKKDENLDNSSNKKENKISQILPIELKEELTKKDAKKKYFLLDVRNLEEWEISKIKGAVLIPLPELPSRVNEIPKDKQIITICKSGVRSMQAAEFLNHAGYTSLKNMKGGVNLWAIQVDPSMPRY